MNVNFPPNLRKYFFFIESLSLSQNWDTHYRILFFKPVLSISFFTHKKKIKFNSYCCKNIIIKSFLKNKIVTTYILSYTYNCHRNFLQTRTHKSSSNENEIHHRHSPLEITCHWKNRLSKHPYTILARTFTRTGAERLDWLEARKISKEDKEAESCGKDHAVIPVSIHD